MPCVQRHVCAVRADFFHRGGEVNPHHASGAFHRHLLTADPRPAYRRRVLRRMRADGLTGWSGFCGFNSGDRPFHEAHWRVDIRKPTQRKRIVRTFEQARLERLLTLGWILADDSPISMTDAKHVIDLCVEHVRPDIWVPALEADEDWTTDQITELGEYLACRSAAPILIHLTSGQWMSKYWWRHNLWCGGIALQFKDTLAETVGFVSEIRERIWSVRTDARVLWGEGAYERSDQQARRWARRIIRVGGAAGSLHG